MRGFTFDFPGLWGWFSPFDWGTVFRPNSQPSGKGVVLAIDQSHTAQSGEVITGAAGKETVILGEGVTRVSVDGKVENISLSGGLFDYDIQTLGQKVTLTTNRSTVATVQTAIAGSQLTFADGSLVTVSLGRYGRAQVHYDTVQLLSDRVTTLGNSDVSLKGADGDETVKLGAWLYDVTVDQRVETIVLSRSWQDSSLKTAGTHLQVQNEMDQTVLDWTIAADQTYSLQFEDAEGRVSLDAAGRAALTLTDVYLEPGEGYTADVSGVTVHGVDTFAWWFYREASVVTLVDGVRDVQIAGRIDKLVIPGDIGDFRYQASDGVLEIYAASGSVLLAALEVSRANTGVALQFADLNARVVLTGEGIYLNDIPVSSSEPTLLSMPAPDAAPTDNADGSGFDYTLSLGNFGLYTNQIKAVVERAMDEIGQSVSALGTFDLSIQPDRGAASVLAEASPMTVATPSDRMDQLNGADTSSVFQVEGLTGSDPNGNEADAVVYINMTHIRSFNLNPDALPGLGQYDLTTIMLHELIHTLGFSGYLSEPATEYSTPFDRLVSFVDGSPFFTGAKAQAVQGGPVPLAPASLGEGSAYYHLDLPTETHLMADSLDKGVVRTLSALDLAILDDIGITIVGSLPATA